jgi:hypothetical protein
MYPFECCSSLTSLPLQWRFRLCNTTHPRKNTIALSGVSTLRALMVLVAITITAAAPVPSKANEDAAWESL